MLTFASRTGQGLYLAPTPNCSYVANLLNLTYGASLSADDECCSAISPFEVLSASSGAWSPASATIHPTGQVKLIAGSGSGSNSKLIGVRYAWADYPLCMLYNAQGVVASPFIRAGCDFDNSTKYLLRCSCRLSLLKHLFIAPPIFQFKLFNETYSSEQVHVVADVGQFARKRQTSLVLFPGHERWADSLHRNVRQRLGMRGEGGCRDKKCWRST